MEIIFPFLWEPLATNRPHFQFFVSAATCERAFTTAFKSHISCKKDLFDANGKSIKNPITVGKKFQKVENEENRFFAITSSKLVRN